MERLYGEHLVEMDCALYRHKILLSLFQTNRLFLILFYLLGAKLEEEEAEKQSMRVLMEQRQRAWKTVKQSELGP